MTVLNYFRRQFAASFLALLGCGFRLDAQSQASLRGHQGLPGQIGAMIPAESVSNPEIAAVKPQQHAQQVQEPAVELVVLPTLVSESEAHPERSTQTVEAVADTNAQVNDVAPVPETAHQQPTPATKARKASREPEPRRSRTPGRARGVRPYRLWRCCSAEAAQP
jgi:hypothetical protein